MMQAIAMPRVLLKQLERRQQDSEFEPQVPLLLHLPFRNFRSGSELSGSECSKLVLLRRLRSFPCHFCSQFCYRLLCSPQSVESEIEKQEVGENSR